MKMAIFKDEIGNVYNELTVIERAENDKYGRARWLCRCSCGNTTVVDAGKLRNGQKKSCGCLKNKIISELNKTHGMSNTSTYKTWVNMKRRCYDEKNNRYQYYGGRGIKVCDRWLNSFENFLADMGERPSRDYSIDRIDHDGNYEPTNCRWANKYEQANNKSTSRIIEYNGKRHTVAEWGRITDIPARLIEERLLAGWTPEKIFTYQKQKKEPVKKETKIQVVQHTYEEYIDQIVPIEKADKRTINLIGQQFGSLIVKEFLTPLVSGKQKKARWLCQCECGNWIDVRGNSLKTGHTTSCGCGTARLQKITKHNKTHTSEHRVWTNLKQLCYNPNNARYHQYGGKGIGMCEAWKNDFEEFFRDMGEKPSENHHLTRRDFSKDFCKENCYWTL